MSLSKNYTSAMRQLAYGMCDELRPLRGPDTAKALTIDALFEVAQTVDPEGYYNTRILLATKLMLEAHARKLKDPDEVHKVLMALEVVKKLYS